MIAGQKPACIAGWGTESTIRRRDVVSGSGDGRSRTGGARWDRRRRRRRAGRSGRAKSHPPGRVRAARPRRGVARCFDRRYRRAGQGRVGCRGRRGGRRPRRRGLGGRGLRALSAADDPGARCGGALPAAARLRPRVPVLLRARRGRPARTAHPALRGAHGLGSGVPVPNAASQRDRRPTAADRRPDRGVPGIRLAVTAVVARHRGGSEPARVLPPPLRRARRDRRPGRPCSLATARAGGDRDRPRVCLRGLRPLAAGYEGSPLLRAEARGRQRLLPVLPRDLVLHRSQPVRPARRARVRGAPGAALGGQDQRRPRRAADGAALRRPLLLLLAVEHGRALRRHSGGDDRRRGSPREAHRARRNRGRRARRRRIRGPAGARPVDP